MVPLTFDFNVTCLKRLDHARAVARQDTSDVDDVMSMMSVHFHSRGTSRGASRHNSRQLSQLRSERQSKLSLQQQQQQSVLSTKSQRITADGRRPTTLEAVGEVDIVENEHVK